MPYYSRIILNSFYNQLFPKLFPHNRRMPIMYMCTSYLITEHNMETLEYSVRPGAIMPA